MIQRTQHETMGFSSYTRDDFAVSPLMFYF